MNNNNNTANQGPAPGPATNPTGQNAPTAQTPKVLPALNRVTKNGPVPNGYQIQRRPLPRPAVPKDHPHSRIKPIFITRETSFMSIIKRVDKRLDKNAIQRAAANKRDAPSLQARIAALTNGSAEEQVDEVIVHGAGRAMQKALRVAAYFKEQKGKGYLVSMRTKTIGTVDGVVPVGGAGYDGNAMPVYTGAEKPKGRIRMVNALEVGVRLI